MWIVYEVITPKEQDILVSDGLSWRGLFFDSEFAAWGYLRGEIMKTLPPRPSERELKRAMSKPLPVRFGSKSLWRKLLELICR